MDGSIRSRVLDVATRLYRCGGDDAYAAGVGDAVDEVMTVLDALADRIVATAERLLQDGPAWQTRDPARDAICNTYRHVGVKLLRDAILAELAQPPGE